MPKELTRFLMFMRPPCSRPATHAALGVILHIVVPQEDVVVYNVGAVIYLNIEILTTNHGIALVSVGK